jgi:ribosome-associated translation inhibitor RaiA
MPDETTTRPWFDGTVNLPTILSVLGAAAAATTFCVSQYYNIEHRVTVLEQHDIAATENKTDVQRSLDKINDKLDKLNDRLLAKSADVRSDTQRWAK